MLQQISAHPVRHQSGQVCPEPVQFRCRAAMRRPIDACLDAAAHGTTKPRQPQYHLSEQRRDRVVTIILHPANPIAAGANRPLDGVLPRLRGGDLVLNPREQLFGFREGQSQIGDIAEVIRLADFHDVHAGTLVSGCRQPQNPLHAPPPVQERELKISGSHCTPSFAPVPAGMVQHLGIAYLSLGLTQPKHRDKLPCPPLTTISCCHSRCQVFATRIVDGSVRWRTDRFRWRIASAGR